MRLWLLICLPLAACQTTDSGSPTAISDLPTDYRQQILARAKAEFVDPYSVRDAAISTAPIASGTPLTGTTAIICVRANAKNRMGAYTGAKMISYIFQSGQITMTDQQYAAMTCGTAVFEPFPELEAGYQPPASPAPKRKG
jgi:hypothetical protein